MSYSKKYIDMQDMILARTALEKVKQHVEDRKEKTLFSWVSSETQEFIKKFGKDNELAECISKISYGIKNQDYIIIKNTINQCIEILSKKINKAYSDLMDEEE